MMQLWTAPVQRYPMDNYILLVLAPISSDAELALTWHTVNPVLPDGAG